MSPSPNFTLLDESLLGMLTAPGCSKVERHWDRCGAYYINPIDAHKEL